jgi:hypothetical protein
MNVDAEEGASAEGGVASTSMMAPGGMGTDEGVPQVSVLGSDLISVPASMRFLLPVLLSRYQCLLTASQSVL